MHYQSLSHMIAFSSSQISKENGMVEASQIMNLYQFIKLYHDIASQSLQVPSAKSLSTELLADSCQASRSGSHDIKHIFIAHSAIISTFITLFNSDNEQEIGGKRAWEQHTPKVIAAKSKWDLTTWACWWSKNSAVGLPF